MAADLTRVRRLVSLICLCSGAAVCLAQEALPPLEPAQAQALMTQTLGNELQAAHDTSHPMRYALRKVSPRLTTTKLIIETKDGAVARLVSINDQPLSVLDEQKEQARLNGLLADPSLQRHRKQNEDSDTARAMRVLRALPQAFVYQYAGPIDASGGRIERFTFRPNPTFKPPDLETEVLTEMTGEMWIDAAHERVTHLEGHLQEDVDFGWGILGRLYKGGWVAIDQADVNAGVWRTVHFQMQMSGRVFIRTRVFDTTQQQTQFEPVPVGLTYAQAIQMLLANSGANTARR